jgi:hypothetical protein
LRRRNSHFRDYESRGRMIGKNGGFEVPVGGTHIVVTTARPRRPDPEC